VAGAAVCVAAGWHAARINAPMYSRDKIFGSGFIWILLRFVCCIGGADCLMDQAKRTSLVIELIDVDIVQEPHLLL
jgi:hypothetical protein